MLFKITIPQEEIWRQERLKQNRIRLQFFNDLLISILACLVHQCPTIRPKLPKYVITIIWTECHHTRAIQARPFEIASSTCEVRTNAEWNVEISKWTKITYNDCVQIEVENTLASSPLVREQDHLRPPRAQPHILYVDCLHSAPDKVFWAISEANEAMLIWKMTLHH
jgi:hypothetical protein